MHKVSKQYPHKVNHSQVSYGTCKNQFPQDKFYISEYCKPQTYQLQPNQLTQSVQVDTRTLSGWVTLSNMINRNPSKSRG